MSGNVLESLDREIARLEQQLAHLRQMRGMERSSAGEESATASLSKKPNRGGRQMAEYFRRIVNYFRSANNDWKVIQDVERGSGLGRHPVVHVLYKKYRDCFEKKQGPENRRIVLWRLREDHVAKVLRERKEEVGK
jgi:hypothetical protein